MADQANLALVYVMSVSAGERNPARSLAARYLGTSEKTWANRFNRLRSLGLLTPAPRRGVAGGQLTDMAHDLLGETRPGAEVVAAHEADPKVILTDAQALEVAGLDAQDLQRWRTKNPLILEDLESWWNKMVEQERSPSIPQQYGDVPG